jgi:hypothetical protein
LTKKNISVVLPGREGIRKGIRFRFQPDPVRGQSSVEILSEIPPFCRQKSDNLSEKIKKIEKYLLARGLHYEERSPMRKRRRQKKKKQ